jgi:hypothetical protein
MPSLCPYVGVKPVSAGHRKQDAGRTVTARHAGYEISATARRTGRGADAPPVRVFFIAAVSAAEATARVAP